MAIDDLVQAKYDETFESVYAYLKIKQNEDIEIEIEHLERFLEDLFAHEGDDLLGRSELKSASISATISACQVLLEELKEQKRHREHI